MHKFRSFLIFAAMLLAAGSAFLFANARANFRKSPELVICQNALEAFDENYDPPTVEFRRTIGHRTLMLLRTSGHAHAHGWDDLVAAVWDDRLHRPVGESFVLFGDGAQCQQLQKDGNTLLFLSNGTFASNEYHNAGEWLLTFDGKHLKVQCIAEPTVTPVCDQLPSAP